MHVLVHVKYNCAYLMVTNWHDIAALISSWLDDMQSETGESHFFSREWYTYMYIYIVYINYWPCIAHDCWREVTHKRITKAEEVNFKPNFLFFTSLSTAEAKVCEVKFIGLYGTIGFIAIRDFSSWGESNLRSNVWPAIDGVVCLAFLLQGEPLVWITSLHCFNNIMASEWLQNWQKKQKCNTFEIGNFVSNHEIIGFYQLGW